MTVDKVSASEPASASKAALLAERLSRRAGTAPATIRPRGPGEAPPLSSAQERLWFLDQYAPGNAAYVIPLALRLRRSVDEAVLADALTALTARHEVLRTRFPATADGKPALVIEPSATPAVESATAATETDVRTLAREFLSRPFDLAAGPPLRALLIRHPTDDPVVVLALHHIAGDGWSAPILMAELAALCDGRELPPASLVQYGDYARWQRTKDHSSDLAYWRTQLADAEPLDLPTDRVRPAVQAYDAATVGLRVDPDTAARVRALASETGATPYMIVLAVYGLLLARLAGRPDIVIGSPVAGRTAPELEPLIGCFVNMLSLRIRTDRVRTFRELVAQVRETALDAYTHQELPFEDLVRDLDLPRDVSRSPLFQTIFAMQNYDSGDPGVRGVGIEAPATRYDLELYLADDGAGFDGGFVYGTRLFATETVDRLARHLVLLLAVATSRPDADFESFTLLGDEDARLLAAWNDTSSPYPADATLHGLVAEQAARRPDAPAVSFEGSTLTYAELLERACAVRDALVRRGVGPGCVVGVRGERSLDLVPRLLGVLQSGAAYLPLDPEYPPERLAYMADDAGVTVVLGDGPAGAGAPAGPATVGENVAYVIYTSGSTGRPKGVPNTHSGIVNRLDWMQRRFQLTPSDVVLQKTPAGFDVSVWEFFWPLITGARLVLAQPGGHKDAAYLRDLIAAESVTVTHFVPSMLAVFLGQDGLAQDAMTACGTLRLVVCSGEALPVDTALRCLAALPAELHNLYGPTEAAVDVTAWHCTAEALAGAARVPIGAPMPNNTVHVLDPSGRPVPIGMPGELHIGGVQLADGYLNRPELTSEHFLTDSAGDRLYRTGDLARWRADGTLDFLGRVDAQIKLRGLRIEPGEIESVLREQADIRDAAVIVLDGRLVAYTVGGAADDKALRRRLPDYMVPSAYVNLDRLPVTANGKLDRRALPAPMFGRAEGVVYQPPETTTQQLIAEVWTTILGTEQVGLDDDFFALGGHSLLATQVVASLRKAVGAGISVMDLFTHRTVRELAALADTPDAERGPRGLLHELTSRRPGSGRDTRAAPKLTFVCFPYGGGSAVVYQPVADVLGPDYALWSVAIPGHDVGLDETGLPFEELAARCASEILETVHGPIALYGHCAIGSALAVDVALRLESAGRAVEVVYVGAIFPFATPAGRVLGGLSRAARMEFLRGDQGYSNWLASIGLDMSDLEPAHARRVIRNMRNDADIAEEYFTGLFQSAGTRLSAPIITIAGERDPATEFYQERFREWHALTERTAVVVLDEAGHFFIKYRATELAAILTTAHTDPTAATDTWRVHAESRGVSRGESHAESRRRAPAGGMPSAQGPAPSMRRFLTVAVGQTVSMIGSALTEFAIPLWVYLQTGSVVQFTILAVAGLVPGILTAPIAGAVVDRCSRRKVMLTGDIAAACSQLSMALLFWTGHLHVWHVYPLLVTLSISLTFQRLAYGASVPQLVPKRFLGHANGVVQTGSGMAQLLVPLIAVGLLAAVGLGGILALDVGSYVIAVTAVALTRFPALMGWKRRESLIAEIRGGVRHSWGDPGFRSMLLFFMALNIFLSPLMIMIAPLVLSFAPLSAMGSVAFLSGVGAFLGGLAMTAWGGPRHRRMRGVLFATLALSACCFIVSLRPALPTVAVGAFGMALALTVLNGIYSTIVQVKVPQRFHGRVFALNTLVAWSTLPLGFALVAPATTGLLDPMMRPGGALAGTAGAALGVGPGRGIALMYALFAIAIAATALIGLTRRSLRALDAMSDARPDDLVGADLLATRSQGKPVTVPLPTAEGPDEANESGCPPERRRLDARIGA